jgi:asparagine synthase (glutamine-hydrolysing)
MCGVTGVWDPRAGEGELRDVVLRANRTIAHRGPDADGSYVDAAAGLALAHRRLSIVDLSEAGAQPMTSASGRYVLSFNGEVYNHASIRAELEKKGLAPSFRGRSDTEVMLAAIEALGLRAAVERFVGMFALALWDRKERRLSLVRDRLGIKPLYHGRVGGKRLAFGSELTTILAHRDAPRALDPDGVREYLRRSCVPAPRTILLGISKLEPGAIVTYTASDAAPIVERYWSAEDVAARGLADPFRGDETEAVDALEAALSDAVRLRMVADVPLGAFLSGGIDSSTVVALMQRASSRPVQTFSIANEDAAYDEAPHAALVARHLGTQHESLVLKEADSALSLPRIVDHLDEPFADSSILPTFLVSELARKHVTVALSGDGGDELFAGYNRHAWLARLDRLARVAPTGVLAAVSRGVLSVPESRLDRALAPLSRFVRRPGAQSHKLARVLGAGSPDALYDSLASTFREPPFRAGASRSWQARSLGHPTLDAQLRDTIGYLPDDILTKVDRASMAVALEARVPILDHRVVELAWRFPLALKIQHGRGKHVLRRLLDRHVPRALVDRPKTGFSIPLGKWMRGPLRAWTEDALADERLGAIEGLDAGAVRALWASHLAGRADESHKLFAVAVLTRWADRVLRGT